MNFAKNLLPVLLLVICQNSSAQELHYDQYTTDDGLPSNTIYEIVQDSNGLLWMGTENGLVSYDGVTFERFTDSRLKDNDIIELEISKDGHVTFSNISNQYCRLERGELIVEDVEFDTYMVLRSTIHEDFLFAADKELTFSKYENGSVEALPVFLTNIRTEPFVAMDFDSLGHILLYVSKKEINEAAVSEDIKRISVFSEANNHSGANKGKIENDYYVWRAREIWQIDSLLFTKINCIEFRHILQIKNKSIVLTSEGALLYEPSKAVVDTFLQNYEFNFGFEDHERNLWLSTTSDGLLKVSITKYFVLPHVSEGAELIEVKEAGKNLFTLSLSDIAFYNENNDLINSFKFDSKLFKTAIIIDNLVYVFENKKVYAFDTYGERKSKVQERKISKYVHRVTSSIGGVIYLASRNAILKLDEENFVNSSSFERSTVINHIVKANAITGIGSTDVIYVGTDIGLFQFMKNDYTPRVVFGELSDKNINCLSVYEDSTIWVGTSNNGLYCLGVNGEIDSINTSSCIGANVIYDVVQFENYVFIATPTGIVRYDFSTQKCNTLNEYRGLLTNTVSKILVKSLDSIFLTQGTELIMIKNSFFDKTAIVPKLVLENVYVSNILYKIKDEILIFSHDENNIEFQFDFYTYRNVGAKMLQYKFRGDSLWITSNDLNLRFPSLKPNSYKLEVGGVFSNTERTSSRMFEFKILPPWWQTIWARLFGLGAVALSIYMIVVTRSNRVKEQEAAKRHDLKQRETSKRDYLQQINRIKDQALQLQMNPHFIFNSMNAIQSFITSNRDKDATIYLAKFAKLIRLIFEYSNTRLIAMEAELDFVQLYIDLEGLRFRNSVTCTLKISKSVEKEKDILRVPPLLVQPIIENSFKHGLFHKLEGGKVNISYELDGDTIVIVVEDNGIGREASRIKQNSSTNNDRYSGLQNIVQRLEIFRFNMPMYENSMLIEDLYMSGDACGTRTTLKITIDENT